MGLISRHMCMSGVCVCLCMCVCGVCVCVSERERKRAVLVSFSAVQMSRIHILLKTGSHIREAYYLQFHKKSFFSILVAVRILLTCESKVLSSVSLLNSDHIKKQTTKKMATMVESKNAIR